MAVRGGSNRVRAEIVSDVAVSFQPRPWALTAIMIARAQSPQTEEYRAQRIYAELIEGACCIRQDANMTAWLSDSLDDRRT